MASNRANIDSNAHRCPAVVRRWLSHLLALGTLGGVGSGCAEPETATLVYLEGCGIEGELSTLRVRARGDFPTAQGAETVAAGGIAELGRIPDGARGITVEGLFGDRVEAVGRTARLSDGADLPIYFAPPDQLCAIASGVGVGGKQPGGVAVGPGGDALLVGGRTDDGRLLDDIVHYRDTTDLPTPVEASLPAPSTGHSLHAFDEDTFVVIGGAGTNRIAFSTATRIDLVAPPQLVRVGDPMTIRVGNDAVMGRGHHGAAPLPDDRVLVIGGCMQSDNGDCVPEPGSVLRDGFTLALDGDTLLTQAAPPLGNPRYGFELLTSRDGVAYAVGGRTIGGEPVRTIERWIPNTGAWFAFGPDLGSRWGDVDIVGATLLEGELLVVARSDGQLQWVSEDATAPLEQWCVESGDPCFETGSDPFVGGRRTMLTLPGERVLADGYILPVGLLGALGTDAVDLSFMRGGETSRPPDQRVGASLVQLDDGSVLIAGGYDASEGIPAQPFLARLRPALDGPDEQIPDVADAGFGSLVLHDPSEISAAAGVVELRADGEPRSLPDVWAHVRGFRSQSFRLEVRFAVDGGARPHIVLGTGSVGRTSLRIDPDAVRMARRDATLESATSTCTGEGFDFRADGGRVRVDVSPDGIEIEVNDERVAVCATQAGGPFAVGIGASGGTVYASNVRVTRR